MYLSRPMIHRKNISNDDNRLPNEYHSFVKKKALNSPLQLAQFERVQGEKNHFANLKYMFI